MATILPHPRDWSSLPALALFEIATRLNAIEFAALAGVCKSWRTICTQNKTQVNAHHPPLLLFLDCTRNHHRPLSCKAYSFPDKRLYSKPLPPNFHIPHGSPRSVSHGYFLLFEFPSLYYDLPKLLYLANPFTEDLIEMPPLGDNHVVTAVLTGPPASPASAVVAFSYNVMMVCRPLFDVRWSLVEFSKFMPGRIVDNGWAITQAVFFKGCVYVVTYDTVLVVEIGGVGSTVTVKRFAPFCLKKRSRCPSNDYRCPLWLFAGEEELFVVEVEVRIFPIASRIRRVYRLHEGEKGSWERVEGIGGRTLFATNCSEFVQSGRRGSKDRVFFVDPYWQFEVDGVGVSSLSNRDFKGRFHPKVTKLV